MIVLPEPGGLLLVRQPDHAASSGELAAAWRRPRDLAPALWARVVEASARHDDGWLAEEESPPLGPAGRPLDFKEMPAARHAEIWRRSVELAANRHAAVGLLVALHALALYRRGGGTFERSAEEREIEAAFSSELVERSDALRAEIAGATPGALPPPIEDRAGALVGFFDALSLMLLGAVPAPARTPPLAFGVRTAALELSWAESGATVEPWPFTVPEVEVTTPARRLASTAFASGGECARRLEEAPAVTLRWRLRPAARPGR